MHPQDLETPRNVLEKLPKHPKFTQLYNSRHSSHVKLTNSDVGLLAVALASALDEGDEHPDGGAGQQHQPQRGEDGRVVVEALERVAAHGRPQQLQHAVEEERNSERRGESLGAQHVGEQHGRDADVSAGAEAENGARDRQVGEAGGGHHRQHGQNQTGQEQAADVVVLARHEVQIAERRAADAPNQVKRRHQGE